MLTLVKYANGRVLELPGEKLSTYEQELLSHHREGFAQKCLHSVRISGRLKIAQRFIAGIGSA
jgi:hypothetical protein